MTIYADNEQFIDNCISRVRSDRDLVIALTGPEGEGKSTVAVELAKELCVQSGLTFDMEKMILFQPNSEQMADAVKNLPRYSPIIADEAIRILYKKKQFDKLQIYLNTLFALARQENKIVILCIPRYTDLNEYFRNHRVYMRVHVIKRGLAVVLIKDEFLFAKDPWHFDESAKFLSKKTHGKPFFSWSTEMIESILPKCANFLCFMKFDDLDNDTKKLYKELKRKYAYLDLETDNGAEEKYKEATGKLLYIIVEQGEIVPKKLAPIVMLHQSTIYDMVDKVKASSSPPPLLLSKRTETPKTESKPNKTDCVT